MYKKIVKMYPFWAFETHLTPYIHAVFVHVSKKI